MLRTVKNWCSFQGPGKACVMCALARLIKEKTGENFALLIPSLKLPSGDVCTNTSGEI